MRGLAVTLCVSIALFACDRRAKDSGARATSEPPAVWTPPLVTAGKKCVLHLHGKGQRGAGPEVVGDVTHVRPDGNGEGWKARQWLYFPEGGYEQVRAGLAGALASSACKRVIVHGFSNGAAAAAKLFCRGETFGGTTIGYLLDDPVPDHGVEGCKPPPGVKLRLYRTGGLARATDGWDCGSADWTCEGGSTIGIVRYSQLLGVAITPSSHTSHQEYVDAPEETAWW
jgi:hypothetical protein